MKSIPSPSLTEHKWLVPISELEELKISDWILFKTKGKGPLPITFLVYNLVILLFWQYQVTKEKCFEGNHLATPTLALVQGSKDWNQGNVNVEAMLEKAVCIKKEKILGVPHVGISLLGWHHVNLTPVSSAGPLVATEDICTHHSSSSSEDILPSFSLSL